MHVRAGWSGAVLANHSEGLARILEGVTGLQMEMMETKLRVRDTLLRTPIRKTIRRSSIRLVSSPHCHTPAINEAGRW